MASFATISKCGTPVSGARATPARPQQQQLRRAVVVKAHQQSEETREVSRRGALGAVGVAVLSAASLTVSTSPAEAFLGIGGPSAEEKYVADTGNMITITNKLLSLARDDPAKADAVAEVRASTNVYVPCPCLSLYPLSPSQRDTVKPVSNYD